MIDDTLSKLAILYADVSGSTRIYEKYGDVVARSTIKVCLEILTDVTDQHDGHVVKTIGDEVMCAFANPVKAALAAADMHEALQLASQQGRFSIGEIHVKIGWHYGEINHRGHEIIGEAPVTAQQVIRLAKADEILTSEQSLQELPDEIRSRAHFVNSVEAEAYAGKLNVYAVSWEEDEEVKAQITRFKESDVTTQDATVSQILLLEYQGKTVRMDADHTHCRIGRGQDNDLPVSGKFTSRLHAEILFRLGSYYLHDMSTNGTVVVMDDGQSFRVHREELLLSHQGTICFGGLPEVDPAASAHFKCVKKET